MIRCLLSAGLCALLWVLAGCDAPCIQSVIRQDSIAVDGDVSDWTVRFYRSEQLPFSIGVENDSANLYLCLNSWDPQMARRLMVFGLTTRFQTPFLPENGFTVRFPCGHGGPELFDSLERFHDEGHGEAGRGERFAAFSGPDMLELFSPDSSKHFRLTRAAAESLGFNAAAMVQQSRFCMELKIPLFGDTALGFPSDYWHDSLITITFESDVPKMHRSEYGGPHQGQGNGMGPPMGGGIGFNGQGGGRHGPPGGLKGGIQAQEPVKGTITVRLAYGRK